MQVFLSYASEDRAAADRVRYALHAAGYEVFFDREDLPPGEEYDQRIRRALAESDLLVFLLTPASVTPGRYTLTELKLAQARWPHPAGRVLPVMLRATPLADVPAYLRAVGILEPSGDAAAEVAHEAARLLASRKVWRRLVRFARTPAGIIALLVAVGSGAAMWRFGPWAAAADAAATEGTARMTPLHASVRHRARFVAATAEGYAVIAGSPAQVVRFDDAGALLGEPLALPGDPVALKQMENALLVGTRAPDAIAVVDLERWTVSDTIPIDAARVDRDPGTTVATDITSIEVLEGVPWVVTGGQSGGDPAVLRIRPDAEWVVATSAEGMLNPPDAFDARGLRLRRVGVELWALAADTSPSRLYRIEWRIRVDSVSGNGADLVSCADDIAASAEGHLLFLSCGNELHEVRNEGATLYPLSARSTLSSESAPGARTSELIVPDGRTVFVALNTEDTRANARPAHARIARVDDAGVEKLLDERDATVVSMAVTRRAVLAVLRRAEGTIEAVHIARTAPAGS